GVPRLTMPAKTAADRLERLEVVGLTYWHAGQGRRGAGEQGGLMTNDELRMTNEEPPATRHASLATSPAVSGIQDVTFTLPRGSFTVITGRVGSGKTTLLRALLGLLPPDGGEVRWNGTPVADPMTFFLPPRSAYTPQVPRLFSEPLRANILMGLPEDEADLARALRAAVLEPDVAALEAGL